MISTPAMTGQLSRTFLPAFGERVFLCRSAVEKVSQLRSRIAQTLNVSRRVRLGPSLAAALLGSLFEQPRCLSRQGL